jgi:hypothetical protein
MRAGLLAMGPGELAEPITDGVPESVDDADVVVGGGMTKDAANVVTRARVRAQEVSGQARATR